MKKNKIPMGMMVLYDNHFIIYLNILVCLSMIICFAYQLIMAIVWMTVLYSFFIV